MSTQREGSPGFELAEISANRSYVKPYPQEALGGRLGLTSRDIASSLGIKLKAVNQALDKRGYADTLRRAGCELVTFVTKSVGPGRHGHIWILDSNAAKIFAAQTRSDIGVGYVMWLLECEHVRENVVPRLVAEVESLRSDVRALTAPKAKRLPGQGIVEFIKKVITERDMFGGEERRVVTERKAYALLTEDERRRFRTEHRARVMRGLSKRQDNDINFTDVPRLLN